MAKTLIERFGFADPDRKTPLHDQICLWVHRNAPQVMQQAMSENVKKIHEEIERECQRLNKLGNALGEPIKARLKRYDSAVKWEVPIGGKTTAGFVDLVLQGSAVIDTGLDTVIALQGFGPDWDYLLRNYLQTANLATNSQFERVRWNGFEEIGHRLRLIAIADIHQYPGLIEPEHAVSLGPKLFVEVKSRIDSIGELLRQIRFYQSFERGNWCVVSPDAKYADLLKDQGIAFVPYPAELVADRNQFELF